MLVAHCGCLLFQLRIHPQLFETRDDVAERSDDSVVDTPAVGFASAIPVTLIVAWIKGVQMDLDFDLLETASLVMSFLITASMLQDGNWHFMKGSLLLFSYLVIAACFFILKPLQS
uniref:Uncharacterized protein n=1 Tax=Ananas comosus var. bracteatus TaxID=296719 RepID=A0A6V7Q7W0_ANACO|nr:unnamed protein product [Ananas comosus var. bracteatus]